MFTIFQCKLNRNMSLPLVYPGTLGSPGVYVFCFILESVMHARNLYVHVYNNVRSYFITHTQIASVRHWPQYETGHIHSLAIKAGTTVINLYHCKSLSSLTLSDSTFFAGVRITGPGITGIKSFGACGCKCSKALMIRTALWVALQRPSSSQIVVGSWKYKEFI